MPQPDSSSSGAPGFSLVTGGAEIEVEYRDGSQETVKVRQLPVRHMATYLACFDDEALSVELFCGKEKGWSDRLTGKSHADLMKAGEELNLPLFEGWYRRKMARAEVLSPGLTEKLQALVSDTARQVMEAGGAASSISASTLPPGQASA